MRERDDFPAPGQQREAAAQLCGLAGRRGGRGQAGARQRRQRLA